jgi:hypothetical protein
MDTETFRPTTPRRIEVEFDQRDLQRVEEAARACGMATADYIRVATMFVMGQSTHLPKRQRH